MAGILNFLAAPGPVVAEPGRVRPLQVLSIAAGNGLEFYDFLIYATFAIYIGKAYFPVHGGAISLLLSLATFGIGFVTRPLGGFVLGRLGDRIGRKPALLISFCLMAVGSLGLAVTPTYARIGLAAPILVILARLVQGFALGGEVGPSTSFLVEIGSGRRRGLIGSMQGASQGFAILAASGVALMLAFLLPAAALEQWGWRLAFLIGLLIVPFGLWIRRGLPETAPPRPTASAALPADPIPWRLVALGVTLLASGTMMTYVGSYMTTFAMDTLHLPAKASFGVGVVNGACILILSPIGGWLSDKFGRRIVMIPAAITGAVATLPAFGYMIAHPSPLTLYLAIAAVSVPGSLGGAAVIVSITESFPASMRCLAVGAIYAIAIAVFGGFTPLVLASLVHATGNPMTPAYYRLGASLLGIIAMFNLPESAPAKLRAAEPRLVAGVA